MRILDRLIPLRLLPSPTEEMAALTLHQVRRENALGLHLATWASGSVFMAAITAATSFKNPEMLPLILAWGSVVAFHAWLTLVHRRKIYLRRHRELAAQARHRAAERAEDQGASLLRGKLLRAARAARAVLRKLSPESVAEVSRGEAQALAGVAWLLEAEPLLASSRGDQAARDLVAEQLSAPGHRETQGSLERLLTRLDHQDHQLARLERQAAERQARVESFLLTITNVELAASESAISPAVSASISERVARLEAGAAGEETDEQVADRIRGEVRLARELQQSILPTAAPPLDGLEVAHTYRPSSEVGGDFYDFYTPAPGRLLIALGDASGHGLDASMVSSMAKSALYLQVSAGSGPADAMTEINRMMFDTLGRRRLMSLALLEIDIARRSLVLANAGQLYPLLVRNGKVSELELPSYPLGVRREVSYPVHRQDLEPGDRLYLLTDGYIEATGPDGEAFGWDRLSDRLGALGEIAPQRAIDQLLTDLTDHLGNGVPEDDVTLITIAATRDPLGDDAEETATRR